MISTEHSPDATRLDNCVTCGLPLPLLLTSSHHCAIDWVCVKCGATYRGLILSLPPKEQRGNVRPQLYALDEEKLPQPDERLVHSAEQLSAMGCLHDRRQSQRRPLTTAVPTTALDEYLHPVGEPFVTVSRNISVRGVSLLHYRPVEAPFVVLVLFLLRDESRTQLIVEVVRCRRIGQFWEIAGRFLDRIEA